MISEKLKRLRRNRNLTQSELAVLSGVSNIQIGRYESGLAKPNNKTLTKLANAFKVDLEYFINEDDFRDNSFLDVKVDKLKKVMKKDDDKKALGKLLDSFYLMCLANS